MNPAFRFFGAVDEREFLFKLGDRLADPEANRILNQPLTLEQRLRKLLESDAMRSPAIFVFDDFEHNLEDDASGGKKLKPEAHEILPSLLSAIHRTASDSRAIVTCRYRFPLSGPARLHAETPGSMHDAELGKKLRHLDEKYPAVRSRKELRQRAVSLGAGNPRLLEWLYRVIADPATDQDAILAAIEAKTEEFREETLLRELLARQTPECRRLIALASVYQMPVARDAIAAAAGDLPLDPQLERAAALGLIETSGAALALDKAAGKTSMRCFVSPILAPLTAGDITPAERVEACARAARHLHHTLWSEAKSRQTEDLLEIHRLALLASDNEIAVEVCNFLAWRLNNNSQFREAELLCRATLSLGDDYRILLALARAEYVLGKTDQAAKHYEQAFALCPADDAPNRGAIAYNWADLAAQQGEVQRALDLWQQSLAIMEQIGDVQGKAATLNNMAAQAWQQGDAMEARRLLLESAKAVASMRAWLDLTTMLTNIGVADGANGLPYFAQAMWLALRVGVPVEESLSLSALLLRQLGVGHEAAPLVAAFAVFLARTRGARHPDQQNLVARAAGLLMACAEVRGVGEDQLADWMAREGLNDPNRFLPALDAHLAAMAGDGAWLFDRAAV